VFVDELTLAHVREQAIARYLPEHDPISLGCCRTIADVLTTRLRVIAITRFARRRAHENERGAR